MKTTRLITHTQEQGYSVNATYLNEAIQVLELKGYEFVSQQTRIGGGGEILSKIVVVTTVVMQKEVAS